MGPVGPSEVLDEEGHLTPAGLEALLEAPSGQAPAELAAHVSSCSGCQDRLLLAALPGGEARPRRQPPPAWRIWVVLAAMILGLLSILISLQKLV